MTTREEFAEAYAKHSGVTVEWLRENGREVRPCVDCDYEGCEGWQMAYRDCPCRSCNPSGFVTRQKEGNSAER